MLARMRVHENAGVAGYSEAFMCGQSGKHASIRYSYFVNDVLGCTKKLPGCMSIPGVLFFYPISVTAVSPDEMTAFLRAPNRSLSSVKDA